MGRMQVRTVEDALPPVLPNSGLSEARSARARWRHSSVLTSYTDTELAWVLII